MRGKQPRQEEFLNAVAQASYASYTPPIFSCFDPSRGAGSRANAFFSVSAGFATVHGNNALTINAVEAYPLDKFSPEVRFLLPLPISTKSHQKVRN